MATEHPHIFLPERRKVEEFTTPSSGGAKKDVLLRDRQSHSAKLQKQWADIWARVREQQEPRTAVSMPTKDGVYVEFEGAPGYDLVTKSLEDRGAGIRLLNVYTTLVEGDPERKVTRATVFIPTGKQGHFLKKLNEYAQNEPGGDKRTHSTLMNSIENLRMAVLESFWRDDLNLLPQRATAFWCEIWLRGTGENVEHRFREVATVFEIDVQARSLRFPERTVLLGRTTREQLVNLIESSPDIAEFRRAKETARFFLELENKEQTEWVNELRSRLWVNPDATVAVCVLDTGANNGHTLLQPVLADSDCHAVEPGWGVSDDKGFALLIKREPHLRGGREPYRTSLGYTVSRDGYHRGGIVMNALLNEDEFLSTAVHESAHFAGMFLINLGVEGRELIDGEVKAVTTEWVFNCVMDC
jgi:hypothetical protein